MVMYAQLIGQSITEYIILSYDIKKDVAESKISVDEYLKKL